MGTLLNRRRYMGGGASLPYDAEVEYIENTTSQRINLGLSGYVTFEVMAQANSITNSTQILFGCDAGGAAGSWYGALNLSQNGKWGSSGSAGMNVNISATTKAYSIITFDTAYVEGNVNGIYFERSRSRVPGNWYMLGTSNGSYPFIGKIYSLRAFQDDTLVLDMIPVRVGQDGYLYDKISGNLVKATNNSTFSVGQDVTPSNYIIPVEYIQSNGNQQINLDFLYSTDSSYEIKTGIKFLSYAIQFNGWDAGGAFGTRANGKPDNGANANGFGVDIKNTYVETNLIIQSGSSSSSILSVDVNGDVYSNTRAHGSLAEYAGARGYRLFALVSKNEIRSNCFEAIYWCTVKINNALTMDLIPVRVEQVGYLQNRVSGRLYGNCGSGSFTFGNDK